MDVAVVLAEDRLMKYFIALEVATVSLGPDMPSIAATLRELADEIKSSIDVEEEDVTEEVVCSQKAAS